MPHHAYVLDEAERATRAVLTEDTCVINNEDFFIRGVLKIPLIDSDGYLGYGVWVSQSEENFYSYVASPNSTEIGPYFGWFCSDISEFAPTLSLKSRAHFQGEGLRPLIELAPDSHPLAVAQQEGITLARAWEIVHQYLPAAS